MTTVLTLTFPHETRMPIIGKLSNTSLQLLQRQLFATKARSVPSSCGDGIHGHLAMLLATPIISYTTALPLSFLLIPTHRPHPWACPPSFPLPFASSQTCLRMMSHSTLYKRFSAALTAQILTALNASFLSALKDLDFGFSNITPRASRHAHAPSRQTRHLNALRIREVSHSLIGTKES